MEKKQRFDTTIMRIHPLRRGVAHAQVAAPRRPPQSAALPPWRRTLQPYHPQRRTDVERVIFNMFNVWQPVL